MTPVLAFAMVIGIVAVVLAFIGGVIRLASWEPRKKGVLSKHDEELYHRAAKIMARMTNLQDLPVEEDGIDLLSSKTQKQVSEWLADYRKEIDRT